MPKTALVLSGGGMFGAYQAGVWNVLSREIAPDVVVGASVGALSGWYIASGAPADELERRWLDPASGDLMTYRLRQAPWKGLFDPRPIAATAKFLVDSFKLRSEYGVALVELPSFRRMVVTGPAVTWRHLVATCAVPAGFAPVRIGGQLYCDGGLLEATPIWAAIEMGATRIVAVNASKFIPPPGLAMVIKAVRAFGGRSDRVERPMEGGPEVVLITPKEPLGKLLDGAKWRHERIRRWIELGESDAAAALPSIRAWKEKDAAIPRAESSPDCT